MNNILHQLNKVQDIRRDQGKRYQLKSILGLVLIGYMSGCNSLAKIYLFGKRLNKTNRNKLGFKKAMPSHPTITETLKKVNPTEFEQVLSQIFTKEIYQNFTQIAIDGKSIRSTNTSKQGLLHLVSAYAPEINGVLLQEQSGLCGGEIKTAEQILSKLNIEGKIITGDALFAQEVLCSRIVEFKADYVMKVKRNQKRIIEDIDKTFLYYQQNGLNIVSYELSTKGHGRVDYRMIEVIEAKRKYFGGWDTNTIKQTARITRKVFDMKKKKEKLEIHYIISSLSATKGSAKDLLTFCRKSQQINTAMRNLAIYFIIKNQHIISCCY